MPMARRTWFTHPALLVVLSIIVLVAGYFTYTHIRHTQAVSKEKQMYATLDKQSTDYINAIAAKYPGKVTHERYCEYGSAKYSEGSLGCNVKSEIQIPTASEEEAKAIVGYLIDTAERTASASYTTSTQPKDTYTSSSTYISYKNTGMNHCGVSIYTSLEWDNILTSTSCGGNALAEHYPVREH